MVGWSGRGWTWRPLGMLLLMALAYLLVGRLALWMAVPLAYHLPGYASPVYPAAGLALVFVLTHGRRAVLAVAAGAICVNVWLNPAHTLGLIECMLGLGAALQAWVAASLVRRYVGQPLWLAAPREIARFYFFGAGVGCLISASVATATLGLANTLPASALPLTWLTWWLGDALGTLIAAPMLLTLIGRPRAAWAPRIRTVALPMLVAAMLLLALTVQVARWDAERVDGSLERDASAASAAALAQLRTPLHALGAMHGLYLGSVNVEAAELHAAAEYWLNLDSGLQAIGYQEHLQGADMIAFEAQMRAAGHADFRLQDRTAAGARVPTTATEVFAVRQVEPSRGNTGLFGANTLSVPAIKAAIEAAVRTDTAVASAAFHLLQDPADTSALGVVIYRAVYRGSPRTEAERVAAVRGVVFVAVRIDQLLQPVLAQAAPYLHFCLTDTDPAAQHRLLAATGLCADTPGDWVHRRTVNFAGRAWDFRVNADAHGSPATGLAGMRNYAGWFASVGGLTSALLSAFLLTVTGRAQRIEAAVEERTAALEAQVREREAAESSNRAKSDFLSRMSHELRTPLNAMLGFAQLLEMENRQPLGTAQRGWVAQIQQAGWHLLEMINDVLDLSRIESGNLRMQLQTLDLPELLAQALPLVQQSALQRRIVITDELAGDASYVRGDATRVKQILTNLLSNAVKYNIEGGRIHVSSRIEGDQVQLLVTDTGVGMTPRQMTALFQPFNRLGREQTAIEGTGIGLVISQRLATLMGGHLHAVSDVGCGSSFVLSLPAMHNPDTVPSDLTSLSTGRPEYHRRHVHYVEDNEVNVEVMRGVLAQRPQVQLQVSANGLDGLAAIRAARPDVVLLDMHLPDISGLELLRHLKLDPSTSAIPIVAVSADVLPAQIDAALLAGAHGYLTKPLNVGELLAVVDELLGQVHTDFSLL